MNIANAAVVGRKVWSVIGLLIAGVPKDDLDRIIDRWEKDALDEPAWKRQSILAACALLRNLLACPDDDADQAQPI